jgi:hypothetical protein
MSCSSSTRSGARTDAQIADRTISDRQPDQIDALVERERTPLPGGPRLVFRRTAVVSHGAASGTSQKTVLPACKAANVHSACNPFGKGM